jgi:hypothetical protein
MRDGSYLRQTCDYTDDISTIARSALAEPKTRWKDDVEANLRAIKITNWKTRIEDKLAWKMIVEQAETHPGL